MFGCLTRDFFNGAGPELLDTPLPRFGRAMRPAELFFSSEGGGSRCIFAMFSRQLPAQVSQPGKRMPGKRMPGKRMPGKRMPGERNTARVKHIREGSDGLRLLA